MSSGVTVAEAFKRRAVEARRERHGGVLYAGSDSESLVTTSNGSAADVVAQLFNKLQLSNNGEVYLLGGLLLLLLAAAAVVVVFVVAKAWRSKTRGGQRDQAASENGHQAHTNVDTGSAFQTDAPAAPPPDTNGLDPMLGQHHCEYYE